MNSLLGGGGGGVGLNFGLIKLPLPLHQLLIPTYMTVWIAKLNFAA